MASVIFLARDISSNGDFETFYDDPHIGDTRIFKCAFLDIIQAEFESEEIAKACSELGAATKKSTRL